MENANLSTMIYTCINQENQFKQKKNNHYYCNDTAGHSDCHFITMEAVSTRNTWTIHCT